VDVGYRRHSLAIGLPGGHVLELEVERRLDGIQEFFLRIKNTTATKISRMAVTMECYNCYARPQLIPARL